MMDSLGFAKDIYANFARDDINRLARAIIPGSSFRESPAVQGPIELCA